MVSDDVKMMTDCSGRLLAVNDKLLKALELFTNCKDNDGVTKVFEAQEDVGILIDRIQSYLIVKLGI